MQDFILGKSNEITNWSTERSIEFIIFTCLNRANPKESNKQNLHIRLVKHILIDIWYLKILTFDQPPGCFYGHLGCKNGRKKKSVIEKKIELSCSVNSSVLSRSGGARGEKDFVDEVPIKKKTKKKVKYCCRMRSTRTRGRI